MKWFLTPFGVLFRPCQHTPAVQLIPRFMEKLDRIRYHNDG